VVAEWRASGEATAEFCAERGLVLSTFRWWRWRLSEDGGAEPPVPPPALVAVRVVGADVVAEPEAPRSAATEPVLELIHPSGARLRVPSGFDERTVAGVLWALEAVGSC
jgi:hypothetical protein